MSISSYVEEYHYHEEEEYPSSDEKKSYSSYERDNNKKEEDLISYCRAFINSHFYGERQQGHLDVPLRKETNRRISLSFNPSVLNTLRNENTINTDISEGDSLGLLLKLFHLMLTSKGCEDEEFTETEDIVFQHLIAIASLRKRPGEKTNSCFKRLLNDCQRFLKLYNKNVATKYEVMDTHWGSSEQLRSGKVISDFIIGPDATPMDPVFGVLLCPYAAQSKDTLNRHDDACHKKAISYHRVMYDAFHFLEEHHGIGPGKDYLGAFTLFHPDPLSAEATSLLFWQRQFNRIEEEGLVLQDTFY